MESSTENGNSASKEANPENVQEQQPIIYDGGRFDLGGIRYAVPGVIPEGFSYRYQHDNHFGGRKYSKRGGRNQGGGGEGAHECPGGRNLDERLMEKIARLSGPTYNLPLVYNSEKKFSGRGRIFIGNIAAEVTECEIIDLFRQYGQTCKLFINRYKNFGFINMDYHANAERAKRELDGMPLKGRNLKIRFAPNGSTVKVKNLSSFVSNELLHYAFNVFGEIERCTVIADDHGRSTGEAIIEFARKDDAALAIRKCAENSYFILASFRPVIVEQYDIMDDLDGFPEKNLPRKNREFMKQREVGPRFAVKGTFQDEFGTRWKQLYKLHAKKQQALDKKLEIEIKKLEAQMEYAKYEHETKMLREQLRAREMDRERKKREREIKQRQMEESKQRTEEQMRLQQEEMQVLIMRQDEEINKRRQENNLFLQAYQQGNVLQQKEHAYDEPNPHGMFNANIPADVVDPELPPMPANVVGPELPPMPANVVGPELPPMPANVVRPKMPLVNKPLIAETFNYHW